MKKIAILPTLLTLGNGICGFVAITYISKIGPWETADNNSTFFAWTGWFLLLAMLFDMLDGYVARLSKSASDFGGELDSLCDVVSFGVAPAFLLLKLGPGWEPSPFLHQLVAGIAALYFSCAALRLARFNVENDPDPSSHKRFKGLPSPGAAGCLAGLAIFRGEFLSTLQIRMPNVDVEALRFAVERGVEIAAPLGTLIVALLMVSNVPYPHMTGKVFRGRKYIGHLIQVLLVGFLLVMFRSVAPLLVFWIYAFIFPLRTLVVRGTRPDSPTIDEHAPHKL